MLIKDFDHPYVFFSLRDGILCMTYRSGLIIDRKMAMEIVATRLRIFNERDYPLLILDQGIVSMDKDARDFFASREGSSGLNSAAMVLKSVFSKVLGNFFLKVHPPHMPVRIFNEEEKAMAWLEQFKEVPELLKVSA